MESQRAATPARPCPSPRPACPANFRFWQLGSGSAAGSCWHCFGPTKPRLATGAAGSSCGPDLEPFAALGSSGGHQPHAAAGVELTRRPVCSHKKVRGKKSLVPIFPASPKAPGALHMIRTQARESVVLAQVHLGRSTQHSPPRKEKSQFGFRVRLNFGRVLLATIFMSSQLRAGHISAEMRL